jgi:RimJ/RimL family protein N-acetyltransferase
MTPADVGLRIDYFHDATDEHLAMMGVVRALLPAKDAWRRAYEEEVARPLGERSTYAVIWELDSEAVGFSSLDRLIVGEAAFMHLHVLEASRRRRGLGTEFVARSVDHYFEALALRRIFCEPNAFNRAPNRTLQRVGFRYLFSHQTTPGPINAFQTTTRWVLERESWPGRA